MNAPVTNLHALHALPASLINRDNNNAAKSILAGGVRRDRVSSQSWKRAIVTHMRDRRLDDAEYSLRTRRFPALTAQNLADEHGRDLNTALAKTAAVYTALGLKAKENGDTAVSIYAREELAPAIAAAINTHWDQIIDDGKGLTVPDAVIAAARSGLDVGKAIDLALTGRMLAEIPSTNVEGALTYAHATSVHPASVESDFFTAVDDAAPDGEAVSSNLGDVDLTAPVLYRSAAIDRRMLAKNLSAAADPDALASEAISSFLKAFVEAVPAAKRTSTNAATLPSVIFAVQSRHAENAWNAFTDPLTGDKLMARSTERLLSLLERQKAVARPDDIITALILDPALDDVVGTRVPTAASLADFIGQLA